MDLCTSLFVQELAGVAGEIYLKGWGEANGGNISIRLTDEELAPFSNCLQGGTENRLPFVLPELAGESFLVTATGVFFRNIAACPEKSLGIIRLNANGDRFTVTWGFSQGGRPTSELSAHLLSHAARKGASGGKDRIILHTHATHLIALTFVLPLDSRTFTRELWEMMTECLILFPEGIGVMPWMVPGCPEIGRETAKLLLKHRLVLWAHHGILGAGANMDQVFGLIETADKAAEMLLKVMAAGGKRQAMTADQLKALAEAFKVQYAREMLDGAFTRLPQRYDTDAG